MVDAQAEEPGDDFGAETARHGQAVGTRALHELLRACVSPSGCTRLRSSCVIVSCAAGSDPSRVVVVPSVDVVPVVGRARVASSRNRSPTRPEAAFPADRPDRWRDSSSVWHVRAAFGWNFFTLFAPMSLCATTVVICGAAQFGVLREDPVAAAVETAATAQAAASVAMR